MRTHQYFPFFSCQIPFTKHMSSASIIFHLIFLFSSIVYIFSSCVFTFNIFVKVCIFCVRIPYSHLWLLSAGAKQSRKDSPTHFLLQLWFEWYASWYQSKIWQSWWISDSIDLDILIQNDTIIPTLLILALNFQ